MKATYKPAKAKKITFPRMLRHKATHMIVLFERERVGQVIHPGPGKPLRPIGHFNNEWMMDDFEDVINNGSTVSITQ